MNKAWIFFGAFLSVKVLGFTGTLDLHAHLFMHEAAGVQLMGGFDQPIQAQTYSDKISSRANDITLTQSENQLVVVALYSHPLFLGSPRDAIRREIDALKKFLARDPNWILARSAAEAQAALAARKRVIVLSLEGAGHLLESEADLVEFIDVAGVRIVTPHHFTDDEFGGASLAHRALGFFLNPLAYTQGETTQDLGSYFRVNKVGLTERGKWLIESLVKRHVWIDYTHSSEAAQKMMFDITARAGQPALFTHTVLREHYRGERALGTWQVEALKKSDGIAGIIPSESMLWGSPKHVSGCEGGFHWFQTQMRELAAKIGEQNVGIGTDVNAPLSFLSGDCPKGALPPAGFVHYGQMPDLRRAMSEAKLGELSLDTFLAKWSKVKR